MAAFAQVVVDAFDQSVLSSTCATKIFDFGTMQPEELHDIIIPLQLQARLFPWLFGGISVPADRAGV